MRPFLCGHPEQNTSVVILSEAKNLVVAAGACPELVEVKKLIV